MRSIPLILTKEDYKLLTDQYNSVTIPAFNKRKLYQELKDAKIVRKQSMPLNVVSSNAKVLIWNMNKGQTFSIRIVAADSIGYGPNDIPVTDPIVVALLGYPTGAMTEWEMKDGINQFKVMSVQHDEETTYS
ncbi:MAG: GreA/GreB family elongation factor [Mucilaginibacter sp.]